MAETKYCSTNVSTEHSESQKFRDGAKSGGGKSSPKTNVGDTERWMSIAGGAWLVLNGLLRRRVGVLRTMLGGALLYRGFSGHCSAYQALGVDSSQQRLQEDPEKFKTEMESETDEMASALGARAANI